MLTDTFRSGKIDASSESLPQTIPNRRLKICIATPTTIGVSETFIQAIVDGLGGQCLHIRGHGLSYAQAETPIDAVQNTENRWVSRSLDLLPRLVEFRIRQKLHGAATPVRNVASFLQREKVDVVLAQYGTQAADILPACEMADIPLVPHFHGYDTSRRATLEAYKASYGQLFKYCQRTIAVSRRMIDDLVELGCEEQKIVHLTYAPHSTFFDIQPDYESNNIVMVGRLTDQKAPHLSILAFAKAAERCPHLRLRIVGEGELRSVCRDLIQALGISDKVDLLGATDRATIQREFSNSAMFLQHSIEAANGDREGTPVAILEAGASGLPVVSTIHAGIPDVVVSGETGVLVAEGDVEGMANAICRLVGDRRLTARIGTAARAHVQGNFTMEQHLSEIRRVLHESVQLHKHRDR
jgi:colanic acid/amylovoran biosynthesis glycosyltransferase